MRTNERRKYKKFILAPFKHNFIDAELDSEWSVPSNTDNTHALSIHIKETGDHHLALAYQQFPAQYSSTQNYAITRHRLQ
jgi:hypothetical protein